MAKNYNQNNKKPEKIYRNPAKSLWGKIIITVLSLTMVFGSLISLIYLMATR